MEEVQIRRIDHHGVVSGVIDHLGLVDVIDKHVGHFPGEKLSVGEVVKGLILNGLGFVSKPLSLVPSFFERVPLHILFREGIDAEDFNRHRIGRCLDRLFKHDNSVLFSKAAQHAASVVGASTSVVHLDSTTFSVTGEGYQGEDEQAVRVTHGHSKDHRPNLKQIVQELLVSGDGGIPLMSKSWSGNESDNKIFQRRAKALKDSLLKGEWCGTVIADSKLYTKDNAESLAMLPFITRIPHTIKEAKELISKTSIQTSSVTSVEINHYEISQRWIVTCSEQSLERAQRTAARAVVKERQAITKELFHLQAKRFSCKTDAESETRRVAKKWRFHTLGDINTVEKKRYEKKGRPSSLAEGDTPVRIEYQVTASVAEDQPAIDRVLQDSAAYIIGTNVPQSELSDSLVVQKYKEQQKVERGFRFLKDPLFFVSSLFLKKPERLESLLMVMSLALLVYSIAERMLRATMAEQQETIPNQIKQPKQAPTLRWVFQLLEGVDVLEAKLPSGEMIKKIVGISELREKIISFFGKPVARIYQFYSSA